MLSARKNRGVGFTLIELLVVISIIALLLSLLLPTLGTSRQVAKAMVCKSNLRQLGVACAMYQNDYGDYLPQPAQDKDFIDSSGVTDKKASGASIWFNALDYYLQQSAKDYEKSVVDERNYRKFKQDPVWQSWDESTQKSNSTIKMNDYFAHGTSASTPSGGPKVRFYRNREVPNASNTVLFVDGRAEDTPSVTTGNTDGDEFFCAVGLCRIAPRRWRERRVH